MPQEVLIELNNILNGNEIIATDVGQHHKCGLHNF